MSDVVLQTISVIFKVVDCYVTDRLIAWLDGHPEVVMELKICSGLD